MWLLFVLISTIFVKSSSSAHIRARGSMELFPLEIIHINDLHDRFEETDETGDPCKPGGICVGGYARTITAIKELQELHKDKHPIYLNAGDSFEGTLLYTFFGQNVTSAMLNLLPADAMTLGNHEFDNGIDGLVPFLQKIKSPVVVANINCTGEPRMKGLCQKSIVIQRGTRKIGIIGVIVKKTQEISDVGNIELLDEVAAVKQEAETLNKKGVDIIIVLSHAGLDIDRLIGKNGGPYIDVIVGGHTHTFLYSGNDLPGPDKAHDTYPIVVDQAPIVGESSISSKQKTRKVYIVQAGAFGRYVGSLRLYFDQNGEVVKTEGNPVYLSNNIKPDPQILEALAPWKKRLSDFKQTVQAKNQVLLDRYACNNNECIFGNLLADAFADAFTNKSDPSEWATSAIGLINVGNIRANLFPGDLKYEDILVVLPYHNQVEAFDITGNKLLDALEYGISEDSPYRKNLLHVSGLKLIIDTKQSPGNRVVKAEALCQNCTTPTYEPVDPFKIYRVVTLSFLVEGGDGFTIFKDFAKNKVNIALDIDGFSSYIRKISPINVKPDGRLKFV